MENRTGWRGEEATISDRNKAAFLLARGLRVTYKPRPGGRLDFGFNDTSAFRDACEAFNTNAPVPVLAYVSAQRQLADAIKDHRRRACL